MKDQESNVKSWEAGRKNLIEEHKFKRENERTNRAALYVRQVLSHDSPLKFAGLCQVSWRIHPYFV
jgi:phosphopantetheinyl transferase